MAVFASKPTVGMDPWGPTRKTYDESVEAAINAVEVTANAALPVKGLLDTVDLNTVKTVGVYRQNNNANGTLARNYPAAQCSGVLEVLPWNSTGSSVLHRFTPNLVAGASGDRRAAWVAVRVETAENVFSSWQFVPSQRVDQTAGRAIYTWDPVNNREQLTYGDTGERALTTVDETNIPRVSTLALRAARETYRCTFSGDITLAAGATGATDLFAIPSGWLPTTNLARIGTATLADGSHTRIVSFNSTTGRAYIPNAPATGGQWLVHLSYRTNSAWPTTLPGAAVGTIPNT